ncbi:hypothetical protein FRC00_000979 [Tulasnella sp. 408]|nr:hypothetical protein FRC00_000979 [Tulasnella sp. 408]
MNSSNENNGPANKAEDQWMSHDAGSEMREIEPALDFEHLDGTSNVQALLCELEAGLGIAPEVEDSSISLKVDRRMGISNPLPGPAIGLDCGIHQGKAGGPSPSDTDAVVLPPKMAPNFTLPSGSASRKEVIDLTGDEEDERVTQASVGQALLRKRDFGENFIESQRPLLPFSPSLVENCQIPRNLRPKSPRSTAVSRLSVPMHGGGLLISPLLPDPTAIPMDTLWDFSTSQAPGALYHTTMPELMAPQPRRHVQDFQLSDDMIAKPVGLGITMDAGLVGLSGLLGVVPPINMDPSTYGPPLSIVGPLPGDLPAGTASSLGQILIDSRPADSETWGEHFVQPRTKNSLSTAPPMGPLSLGPAFTSRPAPPISLPDGPTAQTSNQSPKKQTRTTTSSWPDFVMAHYNPRCYSNPPVLHGSPIKVKKSDGPVRGADLKIVSTRYPFPARGEAKLPQTPEKKRKATYPDASTVKAAPSPARPPNIGQSRKVVQAFAAQKAERNEERARTGTIGPASLNQEKTTRKRERKGGSSGEPEVENNGAKDTKLDEGGVAANVVVNVPHVDWTIFGGTGAEIQWEVANGVPAGALQGAVTGGQAPSGLTLAPVDDWVSTFLGAAGTSLGPASLPTSQLPFDYPFTFNPSNSCIPTISFPSHFGEPDPTLWPVEFSQPLGSFLPTVNPGAGSLLVGQKRAFHVENDEDEVGPAPKRVRI